MTKEQHYFMQILADFLHCRKTDAVEGIQWEDIAHFAAAHQMNGIVYHQCKENLPQEGIGAQLHTRFLMEVIRYTKRSALFQEIRKALTEANIPFFTVKGLEVAQYYPIPELRTMGDCDIVVRSADKERAHEILISKGFDSKVTKNTEWHLWKNDLLFELHDHLQYEEGVNTKESIAFGDRVWEHLQPSQDSSQAILEWEFHTAFLIVHLKKHFLLSGVGFRQFLDLAVVAQKCDLRWDTLIVYLDEMHLLPFARVCYSLMDRWFGIKTPLGTMALDDAFVEEATVKILGNGAFGLQDESNLENSRLNAIGLNNGPRTLVRITNLVHHLFPPYRDMCYVPQYRFLLGKPWLLPIGWLYRYYYTLRYQRSKVGTAVENATVSNEQVDAQLAKLSKWGL